MSDANDTNEKREVGAPQTLRQDKLGARTVWTNDFPCLYVTEKDEKGEDKVSKVINVGNFISSSSVQDVRYHDLYLWRQSLIACKYQDLPSLYVTNEDGKIVKVVSICMIYRGLTPGVTPRESDWNEFFSKFPSFMENWDRLEAEEKEEIKQEEAIRPFSSSSRA